MRFGEHRTFSSKGDHVQFFKKDLSLEITRIAEIFRNITLFSNQM